MSRRKKVNKFSDQVVLLGNINEQVIDDGTSGPMVGMLAEKGIVLSDDIAIGVTASANNVLFLAQARLSQKLLQQRKSIMKPIVKHNTDCLQFLKSLFKPNFKAIGDWGATITDGGKITYPTSTTDQMTLLNAIKTQNDSYAAPAVSPLAAYLTSHNISLSNDATNGAIALLRETAAATAKSSSENYRELRDEFWPGVLNHINEIGDFGMKFFKGNTKALTSYGFTIVDSAPVDKERSIVLFISEKKLNIVVKIKSTIKNTGTVGINIYKGKTISGAPILLGPGEIFLVIQGYSIVSLENTSASEKGEVTLIPA